MILFLIVLSALHHADGNYGIPVPFMRYLATETFHKGDRIPIYHRPFGGRRQDETSGVTFQSRFYETGRRPIQQFFLNIYIKDSPNLTANNFMSFPKSAMGFLRNETGYDNDEAGGECNECRRSGDISKRVLNAIGETTETVSTNKPIKFQVEKPGRASVLGDHTEDEVLQTSTGLLRRANLIQNENTTPEHSAATEGKTFFQFGSDEPKQRNYPVYGSHSYLEIMRKLQQLKLEKTNLYESKMAGNVTHSYRY